MLLSLILIIIIIINIFLDTFYLLCELAMPFVALMCLFPLLSKALLNSSKASLLKVLREEQWGPPLERLGKSSAAHSKAPFGFSRYLGDLLGLFATFRSPLTCALVSSLLLSPKPLSAILLTKDHVH